MATNTDTHVSRVILDTKEAKDKLNELQNKLKEVQKARDEAYAKGESTTALERQIKRLKAETKAYMTSQEKVNQVLNNLSSASYKELQLVAKALNRELKSGAIKRNSDEWKKLQKQLKQVRAEMQHINDEGKASRSLFSRMWDGLNKNWGAFTQILGSLTTLTLTLRAAAQAYADMEESMADVRKYTGQTDEQVHQMNEDFKRMDTRTAREQLNELAGSAGRLGITSKEMIEPTKSMSPSTMTSARGRSIKSASSPRCLVRIRPKAFVVRCSPQVPPSMSWHKAHLQTLATSSISPPTSQVSASRPA